MELHSALQSEPLILLKKYTRSRLKDIILRKQTIETFPSVENTHSDTHTLHTGDLEINEQRNNFS